jgi:hypothetical protein
VDLSEIDSNKWAKLIEHVAKCNSSVERFVMPKASGDDSDLRRLIKQSQRRFTADEALAVISYRAGGGTVYSLAEKHECHRTTISRILKSHDVELANPPIDPEKVDETVRLYESGLSMETVTQGVGLPAKTIFNYAHRSRDEASREAAAT